MSNKRTPWKWMRRAGILLAVLGLLWVLVLQYRMETFPDNPSADGDVGIVLGSALKQNQPSPSLQERLERAVVLFQGGKISSIIVSGGLTRTEFDLSEAEGMRAYLIERGIPDSHIVMEQKATNTYENLRFSKRLMSQNNWHTAVIITHRYHMLRAMEMAEFLGYDQPQASPVDSKVLSKFWSKLYETAAHVKWLQDQLFLLMGFQA
ncbi:YdcF family protein [Paenibacillus agricola]|uniref:YdcF family protein n=1 Tax=Paenibacillus agricola TaxID=2716264 RepID=A0ABX0J7B6_9BACL|nr:YdcF family protein [Paenibacillus agricola]NHN30762.1 YdcF family protein [Paenibacillus agricola]